jgi:hypothetical protein
VKINGNFLVLKVCHFV